MGDKWFSVKQRMPPEYEWVRTKLEGESGQGWSFWRLIDDDEPEWIAPDGRTTVTHTTYAAPSHWAPGGLQLATCMGSEAYRIALGIRTVTFPAQVVLNWLARKAKP